MGAGKGQWSSRPRSISFRDLPKGDKMELIIQKAVELGVYEIIPVATDRAVVKLDQKKAAAKVKRWQAIAESAAKQSRTASDTGSERAGEIFRGTETRV